MMGYKFITDAGKDTTIGEQFARDFGGLEQLAIDQNLQI